MRLCARTVEKIRIYRRKCIIDALGGVNEGFEKEYRTARAFVGQVSDSVFSASAALRSGPGGLTSAADPVIILPASVRIGEGDMVVLREKEHRAVRLLRQQNYVFARLERMSFLPDGR